ncbi:MAG: YdcF family protein, partial [Planctomycetota bacterium]|nr:YdcF family protein [Planctomycetota bacterium]
MRSGLAWLALQALRSWSLCLGLFTLVNVAVALGDGGVDSNLWWLDLRFFAWPGPALAFTVLGSTFVAICLVPGVITRTGMLLGLVRCVLLAAILASLQNLWVVASLHLTGAIGYGGGLPFSAFVACFLVGLLLLLPSLGANSPSRRPAADQVQSRAMDQGMEAATGVGHGRLASTADEATKRAEAIPSGAPPVRVRRPLALRLAALAGGAGAFALLVPLGLVSSFGSTRYVGPAEVLADGSEREPAAAIVFGAGVRSDGSPSLALFDRTRTAIDLHLDGHVDHLILSGGPGPGGQHEVAAMLAMATEAGIPSSACIQDRVGLSTWDTAANTAELLVHWPLPEPPPRQLFAVSHAYHTPRIELAFQRHGIDP